MPPFALTIFIGAFLLFLVQPLIGKYILPWFGGTPGDLGGLDCGWVGFFHIALESKRPFLFGPVATQ